jgi:hypothetical protein
LLSMPKIENLQFLNVIKSQNKERASTRAL